MAERRATALIVCGAVLDAYSLDQAVGDLIAAVESHSAFTLTPEQARYVLAPQPGAFRVPASTASASTASASTASASTAQGRPTPDRLAPRARRPDAPAVATGGHSNLPVIVIAAGPPLLARQVRGYHHMTDVGRLLFEALGGAPGGRRGAAAPAAAARRQAP